MNMTALVIGGLIAAIGAYLAIVQRKKAAGTALELHLSAPEGASGTVVVDLGLVEV